MIVPTNHVILDNYQIVNTNKKNETQTVKVVQKVHPDLLDKVRALENHMRGNPLENQIGSLNAKEAQDALVAVEKELERREGGTSDSWTWNWLNSSNSESSWGLGGLWNWMSSFISNLGSYSTETLQATRDSLSRRLTNNNTNNNNNNNG